MAYFVDITERDLEHLRGQLTPAGFTRVRDWVVTTLENCSDSFREERRLPSAAGSGESSACFEVSHITFDGGRFYLVRLIVDDWAPLSGSCGSSSWTLTRGRVSNLGWPHWFDPGAPTRLAR
jgi:hypothetical protein